ncbi:MAG: hypothetical protein LBF71_05595 [Campylobacteraceae bacterium]|jgi:hypothetical protein|nr:hypothetical protein [Campylobacteraceae bacterium]
MANFDLKKLFGIKHQKTEKEIAREIANKGDVKKSADDLNAKIENIAEAKK